MALQEVEYAVVSSGEVESARLRRQASVHHVGLILELRRLGESGDVIDIGCADGSAFHLFKDAGFRRVRGVEKDKDLLSGAKKRAAELGLEFSGHVDDIRQPKLGTLDERVAFSGFVACHAGLDHLVRFAGALLQPGALLGVSDCDYAAIVVGGKGSEPVADLVAAVKKLRLSGVEAFHGATATFARFGFEPILESTPKRHFRGRDVLEPFAFVEAMAQLPETEEVRRALDRAKAPSQDAYVEVTYLQTIVRKTGATPPVLKPTLLDGHLGEN